MTSDEVKAYNNGLIIGLSMGGVRVVKSGGKLPMIAGWGSQPSAYSLFTEVRESTAELEIGFLSSWALVPTRELVPIPGGLMLPLAYSEAFTQSTLQTHSNKSYLMDIEYSDGGIF